MKALLLLLGLALAAFAGWRLLSAEDSCHYRLTVEVEIDGRTVAGSGVMANRFSRNPLPIGMPYRNAFRGGAVAVDLGERGVLFALLAGRTPGGHLDHSLMPMLPERVFERTGQIPTNKELLARGLTDLRTPKWEAICRLDAKAELREDEIPFLVRFRNIADPTTVEAVDPANLAASFGPGVRLKRVTLEMTRDPVTTGIEKWLPWLEAWRTRGGNISGTVFFDRPPQPEKILIPTHFRRE